VRAAIKTPLMKFAFGAKTAVPLRTAPRPQQRAKVSRKKLTSGLRRTSERTVLIGLPSSGGPPGDRPALAESICRGISGAIGAGRKTREGLAPIPG
jgi:hypothetical protein